MVYSKGTAPNEIHAGIVEKYYRYDSGAKEFKQINGNKSISQVVDAVSLPSNYFHKVSKDKIY